MENLPENLPQNKFLYKKPIFYLLGAFFVLIFFYFLFLKAPSDFPEGNIVNVPLGANLRSISRDLQDKDIIKSRLAFEAFVIFYGGEKHLIPADYLFEESVPVYEVARRISRGERHLAPVKVTIPEGFNYSEIADTFGSKLTFFNKEKFISEAKSKEGYLFPDTYFFLTTDNEASALRLMHDNYERKVAPLRPAMLSAGKTEKEIIIMASLIEREAKGHNDRGFISGILWKRLGLGMALQVDAAPETYKSRGLPKNPIANPGLDSIKAAITPQKSDYLYYLHDKDGNIHFARTFTEHKANKAKYLQ